MFIGGISLFIQFKTSLKPYIIIFKRYITTQELKKLGASVFHMTYIVLDDRLLLWLNIKSTMA